jgi:hypothetical protein
MSTIHSFIASGCSGAQFYVISRSIASDSATQGIEIGRQVKRLRAASGVRAAQPCHFSTAKILVRLTNPGS